jgi:hydroxypyruvate isomerase
MDQLTRRQVLAGAGGAVVAASAVTAGVSGADDAVSAGAPRRASKGRIKQSLVWWCYEKHWNGDVERLCQAAKGLGVQGIELIDPKHWPTLKKHGLVCAIASSHGFTRGMNNPKNWDFAIGRLREQIDHAAAIDFPGMTPLVITFTGMREEGIPDDVGMNNCVEGYKKVIGYAEQRKVMLCLEMLNSRVDANMKGHPGYQGDHTDYCIELIKKLGSERLKLLFDIYHVQIMDGDVITRIRQHKDYIAHVHTAGNPGRGELDNKQEINYPPIMEALVEVGYQGYVGQEFIPTRDALQGLREAVALCDV